MQVLTAPTLRVEDDGQRLRVVVPSSARVSERMGWSLSGGTSGVLGAMILASVWAQVMALASGLVLGAPLLLAAAWMFWKAARLGNIVWIFDRDRQALLRAGRVVARFDELSSARCRASTGRSGAPLYELTIVLHRNRSFRDVHLASTAQAFGSGSPADHTIFKQAAACITGAIGADVAHR